MVFAVTEKVQRDDPRRICGECCGDERKRGQGELGGAAINVRNRPPSENNEI